MQKKNKKSLSLVNFLKNIGITSMQDKSDYKQLFFCLNYSSKVVNVSKLENPIDEIEELCVEAVANPNPIFMELKN